VITTSVTDQVLVRVVKEKVTLQVQPRRHAVELPPASELGICQIALIVLLFMPRSFARHLKLRRRSRSS